MVLAVGDILFEFIHGTVFAHVLVLLCLKCIVLYVVWSLCVIVRLARLQERSRMRHDSNMGSLGTKRACTRFKNGSRMFRSHVRSSCVLLPLSATRSLILNVSTCKVVHRRHDDPTNGPMGHPSMGRLP